jgi:hypothetical protein
MKQSFRKVVFIFTIPDTLDDKIQKVRGSKSKGSLLYLTTIVFYFHKLLDSGLVGRRQTSRKEVTADTKMITRHNRLVAFLQKCKVTFNGLNNPMNTSNFIQKAKCCTENETRMAGPLQFLFCLTTSRTKRNLSHKSNLQY